MSTYGYAPPPPPPPTSAGPSYGHPSGPYPQHGHGRGGGASNSRRGGHYHGGRGEFHGSQPHYEYTSQPYPAHNLVPYGGSHPPAGSYPPHQPQWSPEHSHALSHHAHPLAPAPLATTNYHPNYAPQPYAPSQYPQQAPYGPPQPYAHPYPGPPPPNQPQWNGQSAPHQAPYGNNRSRGGYSDRGGHKSSHGAASVRHGFERDAPTPPVLSGFGQLYSHDPRVTHYPPAQYAYSDAPHAPPHQDSYYGQHPRRGRGGGGGHKEGNMRGRGGGQNHHHSGDKPRHQKQQNASDGNQKPESPSVGKKKKRKVNTLGLTPGMDSETEDDEGEEKVLTELIGRETLDIRDISTFLAERKKNYPTKARIEARKAAELAQNQEDKAASLEKEADRLRKQLRKVEFSIKRKREQGDEGDEMRNHSEESSDDEPEVLSTRAQTAALPPLPAKKADITRHCKYYSTGGTCGKKGKCRFVHDPQVREAALKEREANNGRLTIQQRLILNDKEQEDLAILQSIQYLRDKGIMTSAEPTRLRDEKVDKKAPLPLPPTSSLLPVASPSLPLLPVKREPPRRNNPPPSIIPSANSISAQGLKHYQGWLLKPYGSTSGKQAKSDDLP